jgi:hypothetical protein
VREEQGLGGPFIGGEGRGRAPKAVGEASSVEAPLMSVGASVGGGFGR